MPDHVHLALALDGAGWHPAARPGPEALTAGWWTGLVREAEAGLLDLVTVEDALHADEGRPGRLEAVLVATRVAPETSRIGLVPTVVATHTEPFHVSKAIATLDWVSKGRAGVRVRVSRRDDDAALFGRRTPPGLADSMAEAADHVEVQRRLWDSWEDDAEIRDAATGRFVDRDKLHYIDFEGEWFSVRGPSITPRPPQGQPVVAVLAHRDEAYRLAARAADIVFVTPGEIGEILPQVAGVPHVFGDVLVFLDEDAGAAAARRERMDAEAPLVTDAPVFTGTPEGLADLVLAWRDAGLTGARLRPADLAHDLPLVTRGLVPELQRRGAFRTAYEADTLRGLLGLPRPVNRYAGV